LDERFETINDILARYEMLFKINHDLTKKANLDELETENLKAQLAKIMKV
jgi:hypothetical protein